MANALKMSRGTTFTIDFNYKKNGVAASLVGATVRFTVKSEEYDASAADATATVLKNVTTGDLAGHAIIKIDPADTALVEPGKHVYDIKVKEASGDIYKVVEGSFTIDGSPTNRLA